MKINYGFHDEFESNGGITLMVNVTVAGKTYCVHCEYDTDLDLMVVNGSCNDYHDSGLANALEKAGVNDEKQIEQIKSDIGRVAEIGRVADGIWKIN